MDFINLDLNIREQQYLRLNPDINSLAKEYLIRESFSAENKIFVKQLIDYLIANPRPVYNISNYPGKADGMPFEWWKDRVFMLQNLKMVNDGAISPVEGILVEGSPNERELFLFAANPLQAYYIRKTLI